MNRRKRQRDTTTDDVVHDQTKKLKRISSSLTTSINIDKYSISSFEDLCNELIYDIFQYLDTYDISQGFFNLNTRFQNLFSEVNGQIKVNFSTFSRSTFQNYYTDFIKPNKYRIKSISISDPLTFEHIFPITENISIYSQLQTLCLRDIEPQEQEHLLNHLSVLPNLSSLTIHVGYNSNQINIYNLIFQLPVLKFCDLSFEKDIPIGSLPIFINTSSPIEHFLIHDNYNLNKIDTILSHLPQIRRLSITNKRRKMLGLMLLNDSIQISFTADDPDFGDIKQFIKKRHHQIKLLYFSTIDGKYANHNALFKKSALSYLPHLKTFRFNDFTKIACDYIFEVYNYLFGGSGRRFFDIQQWFFTHEPMSEEYLHDVFCSFRPHRRKYYTITRSTIMKERICHVKSVMNSVHNVIIGDEDAIFCGKYFPHIAELILPTCYNNRRDWFASNEFRRMISLSQLTKLTIHHKYKFLKVLDMLVQTPNIHTLTLKCLQLGERETMSLEESESFRLVCNRNKIKNVVITTQYSLKMIEILIKLCSGLQHLTLGISRHSLEETVRFLLTSHIETPCHVSSLCILNVDTMWIDRLKTIVESKKRLDDYTLKVVSSNFYLWWSY